MRPSDAALSTGPTSFSTNFVTGDWGHAREGHPDQAAERSADPVHGLHVQARDERHHVVDVDGDLILESVSLSHSESPRPATSGQTTR